jgi:hypothetical protein
MVLRENNLIIEKSKTMKLFSIIYSFTSATGLAPKRLHTKA